MRLIPASFTIGNGGSTRRVVGRSISAATTARFVTDALMTDGDLAAGQARDEAEADVFGGGPFGAEIEILP